jgi:hypothetical protein
MTLSIFSINSKAIKTVLAVIIAIQALTIFTRLGIQNFVPSFAVYAFITLFILTGLISMRLLFINQLTYSLLALLISFFVITTVTGIITAQVGSELGVSDIQTNQRVFRAYFNLLPVAYLLTQFRQFKKEFTYNKFVDAALILICLVQLVILSFGLGAFQ